MSELSVDHLLGIKYLKKEDIDLIFATADHFKEVINRPIKKFLRFEILRSPICFLKTAPVPDYLLNWLKRGLAPMW